MEPLFRKAAAKGLLCAFPHGKQLFIAHIVWLKGTGVGLQLTVQPLGARFVYFKAVAAQAVCHFFQCPAVIVYADVGKDDSAVGEHFIFPVRLQQRAVHTVQIGEGCILGVSGIALCIGGTVGQCLAPGRGDVLVKVGILVHMPWEPLMRHGGIRGDGGNIICKRVDAKLPHSLAVQCGNIEIGGDA